MAFLGNNSETAVVNEVKLYTGIAVGKVVAVCPTKDELEKIGINVENEPVYVQEPKEDGTKSIRLDFYLKFNHLERPVKLALFLQDNLKSNKEGTKQQFIDKCGVTCWGDPSGKAWFDEESARPALVGEEELVSFVRNWINVKPKDSASFENPSEIVKGNLKELKELFKAFPTNSVRVLLTVRHANDGKSYQGIYSRYFDRATNTTFTYWSKHIKDQAAAGYPLKDSYSLELKEYVAVAPSVDAKPASAASAVNEDF